MDTNIYIHICRCICRHAHKHTCTHACIHTQTHHEDIRPQKWGWTCIRLLSLFVSELHMLLLLVYSLIHSPTHCTFCLLLFLKLLLPFHSILCHYDLSVIEAYIHSACPAFIHTFIRSSPVESYNYSASFHKALIAAGMSMVNPSYPFMRLFVRSWVIL